MTPLVSRSMAHLSLEMRFGGDAANRGAAAKNSVSVCSQLNGEPHSSSCANQDLECRTSLRWSKMNTAVGVIRSNSNSGVCMTKLLHFVLLAVLGISLSFAQLNRGTLTGIIADPSGAVVPGVKVTAIHVETGTSSNAVASEGGSYTIPALQIGVYRMEFEAAGFKKIIRNQVELAAGATLRQDVTLEIGSVGESVQVSAQASPLETETTRQATTIQEKLVRDMPLFVNGSIRS